MSTPRRTRFSPTLVEGAAPAPEPAVTVAGVTDLLLKIAEQGEAAGQAPMLAVARAALMDVAKLNGLAGERPAPPPARLILSDHPQTDEEWAKAHDVDLGAPAGAAAQSH